MRLRNLLGLVMVMLFSILLVGCGAEKPKDSADSTIAAYMEIYTFADKTNVAKTGQKPSDIDAVIQNTNQGLKQLFAAYEITDAQQAQLAKKYLDVLKKNSNVTTKIKTASDTEPVVEVSMNRIDGAAWGQMMQNDEGLMQIGVVKGLIMSGQGGDATMKDYQDAVTERLELLIENIPFKATADKIDVPCQLGKGEGDKTFWTPKDLPALTNFIAGN